MIFTTQRGTLVNPENLVRRSFNPLLSRANLPDIRFHDLRHTCATVLLGRGVHPKLALRMQIEDLEREISEYEGLKEGRLLSFGVENLDTLGELLTKARIACGLTQEELGEILGMTKQQVQRYERDGWQKISLWRLAEAADALGLDLSIRARLPASSTASTSRIG